MLIIGARQAESAPGPELHYKIQDYVNHRSTSKQKALVGPNFIQIELIVLRLASPPNKRCYYQHVKLHLMTCTISIAANGNQLRIACVRSCKTLKSNKNYDQSANGPSFKNQLAMTTPGSISHTTPVTCDLDSRATKHEIGLKVG